MTDVVFDRDKAKRTYDNNDVSYYYGSSFMVSDDGGCVIDLFISDVNDGINFKAFLLKEHDGLSKFVKDHMNNRVEISTAKDTLHIEDKGTYSFIVKKAEWDTAKYQAVIVKQ